jgi:hypothetical protein
VSIVFNGDFCKQDSDLKSPVFQEEKRTEKLKKSFTGPFLKNCFWTLLASEIVYY